MLIKRAVIVIREHIVTNKMTYFSLLIFYIVGIVLGALAVGDLDYKQKDDMNNFLDIFIKFANNNVEGVPIFQSSLLDNLKIVALFWILGFSVIGFPLYYIVIAMRGFSTGFSSGMIIGTLGTKGIIISTVCFLPKEIILLPCFMAIAANGIKFSIALIKGWFMKSIKVEKENSKNFEQKFGIYNFVSAFFSLLLLFSALFEAFISTGVLKLITIFN